MILNWLTKKADIYKEKKIISLSQDIESTQAYMEHLKVSFVYRFKNFKDSECYTERINISLLEIEHCIRAIELLYQNYTSKKLFNINPYTLQYLNRREKIHILRAFCNRCKFLIKAYGIKENIKYLESTDLFQTA